MKVVDMHCDTIGEILKDHQNGGNMSILENSLHIDLQKMKKEIICCRISVCLFIWNPMRILLNTL